MFKNLYLKKSYSYKNFLVLLFVIISDGVLASLLLSEDLHHIGKSLALFFAFIVSFGGVLYFLSSHPQFSCICAFISNLIFGAILLWISKTYGSEIDLSLLFNLIACSSLLFALALGGTLLIAQSLVFFYFALFYSLFNFSDTYLYFFVLLTLGIYLAFKSGKQWIKTFNFLNLFYFFSLLFIFRQFLWLLPLWIAFCSLLLSCSPKSISNSAVERLCLFSLALIVLFLENSDLLISDILQGNWMWIFALVTLGFWLWIESKWFVSIFVFLFVCTPIIEAFLFQNEIFYLYFWLLFFLIWFQIILKWPIFGFCLLCSFVSFEYLSYEGDYSSLGLFFILSCIIFFTTVIMRSENAK